MGKRGACNKSLFASVYRASSVVFIFLKVILILCLVSFVLEVKKVNVIFSDVHVVIF